jgi:Zn-dependent protease with chaperone function
MNVKKLKILFLLFFLLPFQLKAQDIYKDYQPVKLNHLPIELLHKYQYKFGRWAQKNSLVGYTAKNAFLSFAIEKAHFMETLDSANLLMYDDSISAFLNRIKDDIIAANPELKDYECHVYPYRSLEPNAYSIGEGIILFNLGLLDRLSTKEQVAAIIAHEMSHDILRHVFLSNERLIRNLYNGGFNTSLRTFTRNSIGRSSALKNLTDKFLANHMEYKRSNEILADSLGYILYTKAGYKSIEAIHALEILRDSDFLKYPDTLQLEQIFTSSDFPFKTYWLNPENSYAAWVADSTLNEVPDSLKTHPDCDVRIEALKTLSNTLTIPLNNEDRGSEVPLEFSASVSFESLRALMLTKDYAIAFYLSLHMMPEFPDNLYLKCIAAHCLAELCSSLREGKYLDYVQFPDPLFTNGYNQFLKFLHNMDSRTLNVFYDSLKEDIAQVENHAYVEYLKIIGTGEAKLAYDDIVAFEKAYDDPYFIKSLKEKWEDQK